VTQTRALTRAASMIALEPIAIARNKNIICTYKIQNYYNSLRLRLRTI